MDDNPIELKAEIVRLKEEIAYLKQEIKNLNESHRQEMKDEHEAGMQAMRIAKDGY
jgi:prefoldin subunit 5